MRRTILLTALLALTIAPAAMAKMTTVKGAKCTACHSAMPAKKDNLTKVAADMLIKHKTEASCKDCHGWADGKLTTTKPVKK
ncbi:MAG TPA: cytochrome c3 family protein [Geothrix sp.]|jgi:nitrate/TMAO reductase-like tetraheme cytochrome c subunit